MTPEDTARNKLGVTYLFINSTSDHGKTIKEKEQSTDNNNIDNEIIIEHKEVEMVGTIIPTDPSRG